MIAENEDPIAEQNDDDEPAPTELARTMLADGFTKPIVVNTLVSEGVVREEAIAIVNRLLKARFRVTQAEQKVILQSKAWAWMGLGLVIMVAGLAFMAQYYLPAGDLHSNSNFIINWLRIMAAGLFVFLFGFTRRKRP